MKNSILKKALSLVLAVTMMASVLPVSVFAETLSAEPVQTEAAAEDTLSAEEALSEKSEVQNEQKPAAEALNAEPAASTLAAGVHSVSSADQLPAEIPADAVVELTADITLNAGQQIRILAGVLDGKGHTITLNGKPLAAEVTGTIQNLGVASGEPIQGQQFGDSFGSMAEKLNGGTIQNSFSTVDVKDQFNDAGGLVGVSVGGTIRNSFYGGMLSGLMFGGLVGISINAEAPTRITECYYPDSADKPVSQGLAYNKEEGRFASKTPDEMKTADVVTLLNTSIQDTGYRWKAVDGSLPRLAAGGAEPEAGNRINSAADLPESIAEGELYELTADITLNPGQQITSVAGVLDGKGHTITLNGKPLAAEVTGTIRNLGVEGTLNSQNQIQNQGSIATSLNGGLIQSCWSKVHFELGFLSDGGLVGVSLNGSIFNSYFAGTGSESFGSVDLGGLIGSAADIEAPTNIRSSYFTVGVNRPVYQGSAYNKIVAPYGKKTVEQMQSAEMAELLNANIPAVGYHWETGEGLPVLVEGSLTTAPHVKTARLEMKIEDAGLLDEAKYDKSRWADLQQELTAAKELLAAPDTLTQNAVDEALSRVSAAMNNLLPPMPEQPVQLPAIGVIEISSQEDLAALAGQNTQGNFYRLTQDIVIDNAMWYSPNLAGVFDGNGHTITLKIRSSVFGNITETGVVQNLTIAGDNGNDRNDFAPLAISLKGALVNCLSTFSGTSVSGFVNKMDGGLMSNCLFIGNAGKGAFVHHQANENGYRSGTLKHCYWIETAANGNIPAEAMTECAAKSEDDLKTQEFRDLLNLNKGEFGSQWNQSSNGNPWFGENQEYNPGTGFENLYPVKFHYQDEEAARPVEQGKLEVSPDFVNNAGQAGQFALEGVPADSTIRWNCDDKNNGNTMAINISNGWLHVYSTGAATVTATEFKADGSSVKVAEIKVRSVSHEIEEIRLFIDGQDVTGGKFTVEGSEDKTIQVQARYQGESKFQPVVSSRFSFVPADETYIHNIRNSGVFRFLKPGTTTMTVSSSNGKTAQVELTSTYVPVTGVYPSISGRIEIHARNSMGEGQFNTLETHVIVVPGNASQQDEYTVTSSNPDIAAYNVSLPKGYIPFSAGDVTFTAEMINRAPDGTETKVSGSSDVTFYYLNPLKAVTGPSELTLPQYEKQPLELTFTGERTDGHEVTETGLVWTYDKEGIVKISRPQPLMQIRDEHHPDHGNWVASTAYEIQGLKPGTVVATGTPVDDTLGAKPVQITITVEAGEAPEGMDVDAFVKEGMRVAADYLHTKTTFTFGDEWNIFTLLRAGEQLSQDQLDRYYQSVVAEVKTWQPTIKPTEVERTALALSMMGRNIRNVGGVDLVSLMVNHPGLDAGSNELAFALIALDARETPIPAGSRWSREAMIEALIRFQNADGGFALTAGGGSGIDTTAMAVQALAPYTKNAAAVKSVEKGLAYLKSVLPDNFDAGNSESTSQVIIALSVLGMDSAAAEGFATATDNLMTAQHIYYIENEGFRHGYTGNVNTMATVQAMQALDSYSRMKAGKTGYWQLSERAKPEEPDVPTEPENKNYGFLSGANQSVQQGSITGDAVIRIDADFGKFVNVYADGSLLAGSNYTAASGSTVITLKQAWLDTLSEGTHRITVNFTDGKAETRLYVKEKPAEPADPSDPSKKINVGFTLYGDAKHGDNGSVHTYRTGGLQLWGSTNCQVQPGATVLDVFEQAMKGHSWVNRGGNYIASIDGLAEFDNGPRSGWMYLLNGSHPGLGVAEQTVKDGDTIVFHYTDDYTVENGSSANNGNQVAKVEQLIDAIGKVSLDSKDKINAARAAYEKLSAEQKAQVRNYEALKQAESQLKKLEKQEALPEGDSLQDKLENMTDKAVSANVMKMLEETGAYLSSSVTAPVVNPVGGEWAVIGLSRAGYPVEADFYTNYYNNLVNTLKETNGVLHDKKYTEYSRVILAMTAAGFDVTDAAGYNLLEPLADFDKVIWQGVNGPIFALIALDSHQYEIPTAPEGVNQTTREKLLDYILSQQREDGAWSFGGVDAEPDMTGMALQSLAPYQSDAKVAAAIEKGLEALSAMQNDRGGFVGGTSEGSAQAIVALSALGIDAATDARFIKNGNSAMDGLADFYVEGGGFKHVLDGKLDGMASEQAYYALVAYARSQTGMTSLYDMTDVEIAGAKPVAHEHSWTEWTVTREATETEEGQRERICTVCGETETEIIPALGSAVETQTESGSNAMIWVVILLVVAAGVIILVVSRKKKQ